MQAGKLAQFYREPSGNDMIAMIATGVRVAHKVSPPPTRSFLIAERKGPVLFLGTMSS